MLSGSLWGSTPPAGPCNVLAGSRDAMALPEDTLRQRTALGLVDCLGSPDPAIRDETALGTLSAWLRAGELDEVTRLALAERLVPMVLAPEDPAGYQRPFAALALSEVARADRLSPSLPEGVHSSMISAAIHYMRSTRDYRAFDDREGWRHAVAHGADLVLQLGIHPSTSGIEAQQLLDALATQVAPPAVSYVSGEPARLARAVFYIHGRGVLPSDWFVEWFRAVSSPAPLERWSESFGSAVALARRHDVVAFLGAVAFAAQTNPGPQADRLGELAHRELLRVERGDP